MINYFLTKRHFYTIEPFINDWSENGKDFFRLIPYESINKIKFLKNEVYIFADIDRLPEKIFIKSKTLYRRISENFGNQFILNCPGSSFGRYELLEILGRTGINEFRVYRVGHLDNSCRFPVFIRRINDHLGPLTSLLHNKMEYQKAIAKLRRKGVALDQLMAVEFCETVQCHGEYRKYSAFRIGPDIIPGHIVFSDHWIAKENRDVAPREEEKQYLKNNPHSSELKAIFELAQIEYGRIDYSLKGGKIQVWEINTNPMIVAPRKKYQKSRQEQKAALAEKIEQSFILLDQSLRTDKTKKTKIKKEGHEKKAAFPAMQLDGWKIHFHYFNFFFRKYFEAIILFYQKN